jgi:hypothetical protein
MQKQPPWYLCAAALALGACASDSVDVDSEARRRKDAGTSTLVDAAQPGGTTEPTGTVSCYSEGAPATTCTLPVHCCFSNYSAQHNGYCTTSACVWGTIDCDGPEDCATGQHCCATRSDNGWTLACQTSTCGEPPLHEELCHTSGTCGARACVNTIDAGNYDLPRTLFVCR